MNKEVKKKWIKALRSGEYKKGRNSLKIIQGDKITYCCLGVLCDLYGKENGTKWSKNTTPYPEFLRQMSVLPKVVMNWAGLTTTTGDIKYKNGKVSSLMNLNDNGRSFKWIASVIEKYF